MIHVTFTDLRNRLARYFDLALADRAPILITRQGSQPIVMLAQSEYDGIMETLHLISSPTNATRLTESISSANANNFVAFDLEV
jgi:antitoxin YefM